MQKFRIMLFQLLLVVLAAAFTVAIRIAVYERAVKAGSFGEQGEYGGITVAEVIGGIAGERVSR